LTVPENVSTRMRDFVMFSLTITALDQTWEQFCVILNKQLGVSSSRIAPVGALQRLENIVPPPPHPASHHPLGFFTQETLENPVRATRALQLISIHIAGGESDLPALLPPSKHPMRHQTGFSFPKKS